MTYDPHFGNSIFRKLASFSSSVADETALAALPASYRFHGLKKFVDSTQEEWYFHSTSSLTAATDLVIAPDSGSGRWLRCPGSSARLKFPITYATTDAAVLLTVPTGCVLRPYFACWQVTTNWTGGSSSAIGLSSSHSSLTTKGDVLGGAGGDVAATLVASGNYIPGTVGGVLTNTSRLLLVAGDTLLFDRITSAFTAGAGNAILCCDIIENAGAL